MMAVLQLSLRPLLVLLYPFSSYYIQIHPDKNPHPLASDAYYLVVEAYEELSDPIRRQKYNIFLQKMFWKKVRLVVVVVVVVVVVAVYPLGHGIVVIRLISLSASVALHCHHNHE